MSNRPKHTINSEKAQSTAEFVLVVPFLLLLFFLMVDFGWLFKNYIVVTNTGREAARCAVVSRCALNGELVTPQELAEDRLRRGLGSNLTATDFSISYFDEAPFSGTMNRGDSLIVCIETENKFISPVVPFLDMVTGGSLSNLKLRARTEMRVEVPSGISSGDRSCDFSAN